MTIVASGTVSLVVRQGGFKPTFSWASSTHTLKVSGKAEFVKFPAYKLGLEILCSGISESERWKWDGGVVFFHVSGNVQIFSLSNHGSLTPIIMSKMYLNGWFQVCLQLNKLICNSRIGRRKISYHIWIIDIISNYFRSTYILWYVLWQNVSTTYNCIGICIRLMLPSP